MTVRIEPRPDHKALDISVTYNPQEYSFAVKMRQGPLPSTFTSLQVNELQLQADEHGRVLYTDGYCPHVSWSETRANPPRAYRGALFIRDVELVPGASIAVSDLRWPVSVNRETGWVCVGDQVASRSCDAVEFAAHTIAVLDGGSLKSIWLEPCELPF